MNTWAVCYSVLLLSAMNYDMDISCPSAYGRTSLKPGDFKSEVCSGGLSFSVSQVPTKLLSYSQSSAEQQKKVRKKPVHGLS